MQWREKIISWISKGNRLVLWQFVRSDDPAGCAADFSGVLRVSKEKYCGISHELFQELVSTLQATELSLDAKVILVLARPPYNVSHTTGTPSNDYDMSTKNKMTAFFRLEKDLLLPAGHGFIFCFA